MFVQEQNKDQSLIQSPVYAHKEAFSQPLLSCFHLLFSPQLGAGHLPFVGDSLLFFMGQISFKPLKISSTKLLKTCITVPFLLFPLLLYDQFLCP